MNIVDDPQPFANESLSLAHESLGIIDDSLSITHESLGIVNESLSITHESLNIVDDSQPLVAPTPLLLIWLRQQSEGFLKPITVGWIGDRIPHHCWGVVLHQHTLQPEHEDKYRRALEHSSALHCQGSV